MIAYVGRILCMKKMGFRLIGLSFECFAIDVQVLIFPLVNGSPNSMLFMLVYFIPAY
jgi:hypothetical protein